MMRFHTNDLLKSIFISYYFRPLFLKKWAIRAHFFQYLGTVDTKQMLDIKFVLMTGLEPQTSGVRSNRSAY